ncbi:putative diheme cytochrome c-553 [hydrocarbon metagenome]|uniref:Putative diheme cytochrome c-553 n=1 Tax=hydrocarbon metagenome TaxID=938273 RepID=A0A0W8FWV5_9ZZZZ
MFNHSLTAAVGPWGVSFSANITSDGTGLGNWTYDQFKTAMTKGLYKGLEGSRPIMPPMPWQEFQNYTDEDLRAIFAYLQSTKPVQNVPPAYIPPDQM